MGGSFSEIAREMLKRIIVPYACLLMVNGRVQSDAVSTPDWEPFLYFAACLACTVRNLQNTEHSGSIPVIPVKTALPLASCDNKHTWLSAVTASA